MIKNSVHMRIAEYIFNHYREKFSDDREIRSIDTRINKQKKEIDDCTTAFIEAGNSTLRKNIERKIEQCEETLKSLELQKQQIKAEADMKMTRQDALKIATHYIDITNFDKQYQKRFIDILVKKVIVGDDEIVTYFDIIGDKENYI